MGRTTASDRAARRGRRLSQLARWLPAPAGPVQLATTGWQAAPLPWPDRLRCAAAWYLGGTWPENRLAGVLRRDGGKDLCRNHLCPAIGSKAHAAPTTALLFLAKYAGRCPGGL